MAAAVALLKLAVAAPALAAPTAYEALHFPDLPATTLKAPPINAFKAGDLPIRLEHTTLRAVQRRFGGTLHHGGDASEAVTWLCYERKDGRGGALTDWFISNEEMGGGKFVTQAAVQRTAAPSNHSCAPAPNGLRDLRFGLPSIGASLDAITHRFGGGAPTSGYLSFTNTRPAGSAEHHDTTTSQTINYHITNGVVDIVSVGQVTAD